jgi:hypothetical protein
MKTNSYYFYDSSCVSQGSFCFEIFCCKFYMCEATPDDNEKYSYVLTFHIFHKAFLPHRCLALPLDLNEVFPGALAGLRCLI